MPPPSKKPFLPPTSYTRQFEPAAPAAPAPARPAAGAHAGETGWLPDLVYTGDTFEEGLAFFADPLGRITRFSREPADLAAARRLPGQAAMPGLVNVHSISWQRALRGRTEQVARNVEPIAGAREAATALAQRLTPEDIFETARMVFTEMLLAGITCVGEFHELQNRPDGTAWPEPHLVADQVLRAAREAGIRIALFNVATLRGGHGQAPETAPARVRAASIDAFLRETEALRAAVAGSLPADEAWIGVAPESLARVPVDAFKAIGTYAHAQRLRVQTRVARSAEDVAACVAEYGRGPVAVLAEHGLIDKRLTVLHGNQLSAEDSKLLGTARAAVGVCPLSEQNLALAAAPVEALLAAGAGVVLGSESQGQVDLLREARALEYGLRVAQGRRPVVAADAARTLFTAATVTGARSLGATGGALEVGRPADFFTVNLYDPSIAGADPETLLASLVFGLERRAVKEVWIGARQRITGGRHPNQGPIVGKFVEMQRRLWGKPATP
ncbi:amidohydrolase family protein [Opitutus sp. ER46]|uniref:amidohydrolase family protein n=1 Tax=Opitutus sp. ER46 TaxID=2161864 RepID=UPI000D2FC3B0|nr:amidohydrolase family protein [Opitutus sp. ER46]PTY01170.1 formimidoylglutamate deiminase [Opitutus sp. ER46]